MSGYQCRGGDGRMYAAEEPYEHGGGVVWVCPMCDRQIVTGGEVGMKVLEQGDFNSRHFGTTGPIGVTIATDVRWSA